MYACSSVQVIPQAAGTGAGAFPSKLPNLLASGVPVFAICDLNSELAKVVQETGFGTAVHTWDQEKCVSEMLAFLAREQNKTHAERLASVSGYIREKFGVSSLVKSIVDES